MKLFLTTIILISMLFVSGCARDYSNDCETWAESEIPGFIELSGPSEAEPFYSLHFQNTWNDNLSIGYGRYSYNIEFRKGSRTEENVNYYYMDLNIPESFRTSEEYPAFIYKNQIIGSDGVILGDNYFELINMVVKVIPNTQHTYPVVFGTKSTYYFEIVDYEISDCRLVQAPTNVTKKVYIPCTDKCESECSLYANTQLNEVKNNPNAFINQPDGTRKKVTVSDYSALLKSYKYACMTVCKSDCGIKTPEVQIING